MARRRDIEDTRQNSEGLALMARQLGYKSRFGQLIMPNGATTSDLLDFFDDNPGACEAVVTWVVDHGRDRAGEPLEDKDDVDRDDIEEDGEEEDSEAAPSISWRDGQGQPE